MAKAFSAGDSVAYSGRFLSVTAQHTGRLPELRGVYLRSDIDGYCRVRWDDQAEMIASGRGQYADTDYCEDVQRNGSLVALTAIAVVGSQAFGA